MAGLELAVDEVLTVGSVDLADAFYHLQLPPALQPQFSLRRFRAGAAGITEVGGQAVSAPTYIFPQLKVCPMAWNWALFWCGP